jgi:hypothetical protein
VTRLADMDAFLNEHRRCGELDGAVLTKATPLT